MKWIFTILSLFVSLYAKSQDFTELIDNSTAKIEIGRDSFINGRDSVFISTGTGFFFRYYIDNDTIPVLVTNYHVVKNAKYCKIRFTLADSNMAPIYGQTLNYKIDSFEYSCLKHPNEDLAIYPLATVLKDIKNKGMFPYSVFFNEANIPNDSAINTFFSIEDIYMIGYPFGFYDEINNVPIVRKGITCTPYKLDFQNRKRFLLDIPIFPGSSGSPVVIYNNGTFPVKGSQNFMTGSRIELLGIAVESINNLTIGYTFPSTNSQQEIVGTSMPINIAVAIKSTELLAFKPYLKRILEKEKAAMNKH